MKTNLNYVFMNIFLLNYEKFGILIFSVRLCSRIALYNQKHFQITLQFINVKSLFYYERFNL